MECQLYEWSEVEGFLSMDNSIAMAEVCPYLSPETTETSTTALKWPKPG